MNNTFNLIRNLLLGSLLIGACLLSGCHSDSKKIVHLKLRYVPTDNVPVETTSIDAQVQLAEAAESVDHSLSRLSAIAIADHKDVESVPRVDPYITGLSETITVNWSGPVEPLLKEIAKNGHYQVKFLGEKPTIPVLINVSVKNTPMADLLRSVISQTANKARIRIFPRKHVIELQYYAMQ